LGTSHGDTAEELEAEIQDLVDQGEAKGFITPDEGDMIEAILDLDDTGAAQIMVPRTDMAVVSRQDGVDEIIAVIIESGHSRLPVIAEDLDHIVGVIHAKDLLPFWGRPPEQVDWKSVMREPFFVPQSKPLNELLTEFKKRRVHLAVVVDEYGGTSGIVTMEDVLEEIVGDISDEYDQEDPLLSPQPDGSLLVSGRLEVEDLADHLDIELPDQLPEGRFETVGGFITTLLGRVPRVSEEITYGPLRMVVTEADQRRVTQVRVFLEPQASPNED